MKITSSITPVECVRCNTVLSHSFFSLSRSLSLTIFLFPPTHLPIFSHSLPDIHSHSLSLTLLRACDEERVHPSNVYPVTL